jgi:hypothetical protein
MADDEAALGEQDLHVTEAEAEVESEVQPDGVSDDLGWETAPPIRRAVNGLGDGHQTRLSADNPIKLTVKMSRQCPVPI